MLQQERTATETPNTREARFLGRLSATVRHSVWALLHKTVNVYTCLDSSGLVPATTCWLRLALQCSNTREMHQNTFSMNYKVGQNLRCLFNQVHFSYSHSFSASLVKAKPWNSHSALVTLYFSFCKELMGFFTMQTISSCHPLVLQS